MYLLSNLVNYLDELVNWIKYVQYQIFMHWK